VALVQGGFVPKYTSEVVDVFVASRILESTAALCSARGVEIAK